MSKLPDNSRIKMRGRWLYDGSVSMPVLIVEEELWPGSGDVLDPPEFADDRDGLNYAVYYGDHEGVFRAGGGRYSTLEEAIQEVAGATHGTTTWEEPADQ